MNGDKRLRREFIRFLKDWGVYEMYLINFRRASNFNSFKEMFEDVDIRPQYWLLCSFTWMATEQGRLWLKLDDEWTKKLRRL